LLSLIEATELASKDARQDYSDSPRSTGIHHSDLEQEHAPVASNLGASIPALHSIGSMLDVEEEEEEKIKMSTSLAVGVAGTYAVAAKEGLQIFPSRPCTTDGVDQEDVETLVRVYHLDQKSSQSADEDDKLNSPVKPGMKDPLKLSYGDRVQVVSVDGGWAKLARGYGFVRAERLVKGESDRVHPLFASLRLSSQFCCFSPLQLVVLWIGLASWKQCFVACRIAVRRFESSRAKLITSLFGS
jgi:hypothetical protein